MKFLPEHVMMEFEQLMAQSRATPEGVRRLIRSRCPELLTAQVPNDADEAAADLTPRSPEGPVYRGGIEFEFVVVCQDLPLRRLGRVLYGVSVSVEPDLVRRVTEMQLAYQVLVWDECNTRFVWNDLPDYMLPFEATLRLDEKISERVMAQERAALN